MKALKIILVVLLSLIVLLFVIALFLPSSYNLQRTIVIKAEPEEIFPYFDSLKKWQDWTVWTKKQDSTMQFYYEGKEAGVGAIQKWTSKNIGSGTLTITKSRPVKMLEYELNMDGMIKSTGKADFVLTSKGTEVTWSLRGELGLNPMSRWFSFLFMDKSLTPDLETGLNQLKTIIENKKKTI